MASLTVTSLSRQVQTALPLKSGLTLMSVQHVERLRGGGWLRSETAQGALSKSDKNTGKVKESRPEGRSAADQQDSNVVTRAAAKMSSIFRSTDEQEFDCVPSNLLPASKKEFISGVLARCMPRLYAVLRILLEVVGFLFLGSIIAVPGSASFLQKHLHAVSSPDVAHIALVPVLTLILDRFGSTFYTDFFAAMSKSGQVLARSFCEECDARS